MNRETEFEETLRAQLAEKVSALAGLEHELLAGWGRPEKSRAEVSFDVEASRRGVKTVSLGLGRVIAADRRGRIWARRAQLELAQYMAGRRVYFSVPLDLGVLSPFRRQVLEAARRIPFGETRTYGWLAETIGCAKAARAAGAALAANPVLVIIPCHRVTRSGGALGGYSLGVALKRMLLDLERGTPVLVGCTSTHEFCLRGCPRERRIDQRNRAVFASIVEARRFGYRPCTVCRPAKHLRQ